jgi:hypothetical protein
VAIPLAGTSFNLFRESLVQATTSRLAQEWIDQTGYEVTRVEAHGNQIDLIINGSGEPPALSKPGTMIEEELVFNRLIRLKSIAVPAEEEFYEVLPE